MENLTAAEIVWQTNYAEAKEFYDQHGRFPTYRENRKLRQWANKVEKGETTTSRRRLMLLKAVGYEPYDKWEVWERNYQEARHIYSETGRTPTYKFHPKVFNYFKHWIINSGPAYPERMEMLAKIGFDTIRQDRVWNKNYAEAKDFYDRHGRAPSSKENIRIFMWARGWLQRHGHENPELARMLHAIGFEKN